MDDERDQDYTKKVEAALFEYVERYGASDAVRRLYCTPMPDVRTPKPVSEHQED